MSNRRMHGLNRRAFLQQSLLTTAGAVVVPGFRVAAAAAVEPVAGAPGRAAEGTALTLPNGRLGPLPVSRLLLGGNLLTHYTHSRDLRYVYTLAARYNTEAKILETLALAEAHGVNTLVIHTVPETFKILQRHRHERGGRMRWIICPTAPIEDGLMAYREQVEQLVADGVDAIYLWGVRGDELVQKGRVDLIAEAVALVKRLGKPSGVGAHDLNVIVECERQKVPADFYIKTFHHHHYATAPRPEQVTRPYAEVPGYWCSEPERVIEVMRDVEKPWIAFKVMAAGAIPPENAFRYVFKHGADHVLAGMFDFEIAEDARIAGAAVASAQRQRPWRS